MALVIPTCSAVRRESFHSAYRIRQEFVLPIDNRLNVTVVDEPQVLQWSPAFVAFDSLETAARTIAVYLRLPGTLLQGQFEHCRANYVI